MAVQPDEHSETADEAGGRWTIGPLGERLDRAGLPPPDTRWIARRKAMVVAALRGGLLRFDEACERYNLSAEELQSWDRAVDEDGLAALKVTRRGRYRRNPGKGGPR